jgi:hypothetical protein
MGDSIRTDAKFTANLSRQLEHVRAQTYDVVYPEMKARQLIPVDGSVDTGAETVTYRQWDALGMAKIIHDFADDLPLVDALVEEFTSKVKSLGAAYGYSIQDLRAAGLSGSQLPARRARMARRSIEQAIEDIACLGNTKAGLLGFAKHPNVTLVPVVVGTWATATGAEMIADMNELVNSTVIANKETFLPDTIVLDIASYQRFASTRISTTGDTHTTAMQAFLASNPYVRSVMSWNKLALADAAGTGPRAVCYKRDPEVLELVIPQEYEEMPPQPKGLRFSIPCHARIGGCVVYYPLAMGYMDGL